MLFADKCIVQEIKNKYLVSVCNKVLLSLYNVLVEIQECVAGPINDYHQRHAIIMNLCVCVCKLVL